MTKRLDRKFFAQKTLTVARELLGKYLMRRVDGKTVAARIIETEAYCGPHDLASHASKGLTPRTRVMFGPSSHAYIYMVYGMYYCLNIVSEKKGYPAAVLIRAIDMPGGHGPGRLCRVLEIDKKLNDIDITTSKELWVEDRGEKATGIKRTPRIGIDYAKEYKDKKWRFVVESKK